MCVCCAFTWKHKPLSGYLIRNAHMCVHVRGRRKRELLENRLKLKGWKSDLALKMKCSRSIGTWSWSFTSDWFLAIKSIKWIDVDLYIILCTLPFQKLGSIRFFYSLLKQLLMYAINNTVLVIKTSFFYLNIFELFSICIYFISVLAKLKFQQLLLQSWQMILQELFLIRWFHLINGENGCAA